MNIFDSSILGIVQGLTEFIPVSSSGHLIIAHQVLGDSLAGSLAFDAIVQFATILAVGVYFSKDLWRLVVTFCKIVTCREVIREDKVLLYAIIFGTIPAVILGLLLENAMETKFRSVVFVAGTLILGSILMAFAEWFARRYSEVQSLTLKKGWIIGCFQALALLPGVSRSGATISGGLIYGLGREAATRFSFLLAFPIILGSGLKKIIDVAQDGGFVGAGGVDIMIGSIVAFVVGLGAIHFLIKYLRHHSLYPFIWYRLVVAVLLLVFFA
ncbi:MAG: undecaprenyl-diphosphatase UppP [Candidatus Taylorbacteria bacterium]|nr:undecaprenyl-diphosphatase UppP [Candidatus Taylorbacteria bacterium]